MNKNLEIKIEKSLSILNSKIHSKEFYLSEIQKVLLQIFSSASVNIFSVDKDLKKIDATSYNKKLWAIPQKELSWLTTKHADNTHLLNDIIYIKKRELFIFTDLNKLNQDKAEYNYSCSDILYLKLADKKKNVLLIVIINNWKNKSTLEDTYINFESLLSSAKKYLKSSISALENILINTKVAHLLSSQEELKKKLQNKENHNQERIAELSVLYESSMIFNHSLNHIEASKAILNSLSKILTFKVAYIFLNDISGKKEVLLKYETSLSKAFIDETIKILINTASTFINEPINISLTKVTDLSEKKYKSIEKNNEKILGVSNIPLIFKDEIIGIIALYYSKENFSESQKKFINTISNHFASILGRFKTNKSIESSKIESIINSMTDPVIIFDNIQHIHWINKEAKNILSEKQLHHLSFKEILASFGLDTLHNKVITSKYPIKNKSVSINNKSFFVSISKVTNKIMGELGTVLVLKDVSEIQKTDRIKSQRLNAISKVNTIIKSIQDYDQLLTILIEDMTHFANAEMGSIQIVENKKLITKTHINFPDKIRKSYTFKNNKTISEVTRENKNTCVINNYFDNKEVSHNVKVLIDSYICIPIINNNEVLGIINIAKKYGSSKAKLNNEDILTLNTIATLYGTAIQNATYYEQKLKRNKLEQELEIAKKIHAQILPKNIESFENIEISNFNIPAYVLSGDYFDLIEITKEKKLIIIADIVGKGIGAGIFMSSLKSIIQTHLSKRVSVLKLISQLNVSLFNDPVITKFIPLFLGIFDTKKQTFCYTNAGHEPPLLLRKNRFYSLTTNGFPLGGIEKNIFHEKKIKCQPDDLLIFFTDGIVDLKNKKQERFGLSRLKKLIKATQNSPTSLISKKVCQEIKKFSDNNANKDDLTMIIAKTNIVFKNKKKSLNKTFKRKDFKILSTIKNVKKIRLQIKRVCLNLKFSSECIHDIQLSLSEAIVNIIEHAYQGKNDKIIHISFLIFKTKMEIILFDKGKPFFEPDKKLNKQLKNKDGSGLGLHIINSLMDKVVYNYNNGNELKLIKYIKLKNQLKEKVWS